MIAQRLLLAASLLAVLALSGPASAADTAATTTAATDTATPGAVAQAQPTQTPTTPAPSDSTTTTAADEPIGNVASLTGTVTLIRDKNSLPLKLRDDIYLNDIVQTSTASALGITFNDGTTFHLTANAKITIDNYVYEDGGKQNSAIFNVGRGTVAFVAAAVAKTGDMKIDTPTATLGIRGTTGLIEVPDNPSTADTNNVAIKLYPDADGRVGHIDVNDRAGARLGTLTQGASGFAIRAGAGGARFAAVPLVISARDVQRDQGFVRQVHTAQTVGRQIVTEQRAFRRANPGLNTRTRGNTPNQQRPSTTPAPTPRGQQQQPGQRQQQPGRQGAQQPTRQQPAATTPAQNGQAKPNPVRPGQAAPNGAQQAAPRAQRPGLAARPQPRARQPAAARGRRQEPPR